VPERLVDRIEVMDAFSLATLPRRRRSRPSTLAKRKRNVPHIHVDAKEQGGFAPQGRPYGRVAKAAPRGRWALAAPGRGDRKARAAGTLAAPRAALRAALRRTKRKRIKAREGRTVVRPFFMWLVDEACEGVGVEPTLKRDDPPRVVATF
jgi:hypothetical protein